MATGAKITDAGINMAMHRIFSANPSQSAVVRFRLGGDTSTPASTDTALTIPILLNATNFNTMDAATGWNSSGVATGPTVNTTAGERVEGSGSLNLTTNNSGTAIWYRTQTASSMASTYHTVMFYNENVTNNLQNVSNAVSVVLGNNSTNTNANFYSKHRSDLVNGWNIISIYTPTVSTVSGTPTIGSTSYFAMQVLNASTMTGSAQRMDIWKYGGSSDVYQTFVTGWPQQDTSAKTIEVKGYLTSTQANNYSITAWTLENSDTTPVMWSKDVTTALDKSTGEEVSIIWVDQGSEGG